jgi:arginyl-tRNA synthetase
MIIESIQQNTAQALAELYQAEIKPGEVLINLTRKEFEGDYTVVVFPFVKAARKKPEMVGEELGKALVQKVQEVASYNVIKGFLNLQLEKSYWRNFILNTAGDKTYGTFPNTGDTVMVEFSSPNTNKPLHLGHIRNILLGWACSRILEAAGEKVVKTQIVNDRGIAICRSMLAWKKFGKGESPESTDTKGDHFVGKYYVEFAKRYSEEYEAWQKTAEAEKVYQSKAKEGQEKEAFFKAYKNDFFNEYSQLGAEAREMLIKWEAGDPDVRALWAKMNGWVYEGFDETYRKLGVHFDKLYFESDTYLRGKELIEKGLKEGILQQDGKRVFADLEDAKLGVKTIIKSDGTSTYTSQDIGTAHQRYLDFGAKKMTYVVADEQNNHFQVLFEILKRLGEPYADGLHHLSYGMVDLPTGRMKSREGTVVDADDLIAEVIEEARKSAAERGEANALAPEEQEEALRKIGLAALKFHIIKVNPKKRMIFDPQESVDLQGQTGPYIQYSYVRINGVLKRAAQEKIDLSPANSYTDLQLQEKELALQIHEYPNIIRVAAEEHDPSHIANYCYTLAKAFHKFWHDLSILSADNPQTIAFRLKLCQAVGETLKKGMELLGIEMPEKM